jgi:hypothetical protein
VRDKLKLKTGKMNGFEVLTAVIMKSPIFWDITPCMPLKVNRLSEEYVTSIFKIEGKAMPETNMQQEASKVHGLQKHGIKYMQKRLGKPAQIGTDSSWVGF